MNQLMLIGRLTRDVEVREAGKHRVVRNSLAVERRYRNQQGERVTDFIPIVAWNHSADFMKRYCMKGQKICIIGHLEQRVYTNSQQQQIRAFECVVQEFSLVDHRRKEPVDELTTMIDPALTTIAEIEADFEVPTEPLVD